MLALHESRQGQTPPSKHNPARTGASSIYARARPPLAAALTRLRSGSRPGACGGGFWCVLLIRDPQRPGRASPRARLHLVARHRLTVARLNLRRASGGQESALVLCTRPKTRASATQDRFVLVAAWSLRESQSSLGNCARIELGGRASSQELQKTAPELLVGDERGADFCISFPCSVPQTPRRRGQSSSLATTCAFVLRPGGSRASGLAAPGFPGGCSARRCHALAYARSRVESPPRIISFSNKCSADGASPARPVDLTERL